MTSIVENWSTTADNNSNADPAINWAEGMLPGGVNNSSRSMMMRLKQFAIDIGGSLVAGGTADALTLTAGSPYSTYVDGIILAFRASDDNTGAATLNVNGIGTASIRKIDEGGDIDVEEGDILDGGIYLVAYSSAANSSAGGWMLVSGGGGGSGFAKLAEPNTFTEEQTFSDDVTITGDVDVTGAVAVTGDFEITGNLVISGTITAGS